MSQEGIADQQETEGKNNEYEKSALPPVLFFCGWLFFIVFFILAFNTMPEMNFRVETNKPALVQSGLYLLAGFGQLLFFMSVGKVIELLERIYLANQK